MPIFYTNTASIDNLLITGSGVSMLGTMFGSFSGSFTGSFLGTIATASYITGSAFNSTNPVMSASYASSSAIAEIASKIIISPVSANASRVLFTANYNSGDISVDNIGDDFIYNPSTNILTVAGAVSSSIFFSTTSSVGFIGTSSAAAKYPNITTDTVTATDNIFSASINHTFNNSLTNIVIKGSATNVNSNSTILRLAISSSSGTTEYDRVTLNIGATARYTPFVLVASFNNISGPGFIQINSIPTNATALSASLYNVRGLITKIPR